MESRNIDEKVVQDFGREWGRFDQSGATEAELRSLFEAYFSEFPWQALPERAVGFDLGCGTGRWARFLAARVGELHCIDPSEALDVCRKNLAEFTNVRFHRASVDNIPLDDASADFGCSLGVLHHIPDTEEGLRSCVRRLKTGAPFLLYLYYAFDNRPWWFRALWRVSDVGRRVISRFPWAMKAVIADGIAALVYWPLARVARCLERRGRKVEGLPLAIYRDRSFYSMRTDALDRFGTKLEKRFRRNEIEAMMRHAGLEKIKFRENAPYWCAVGYRAAE